MQDSLFFHIVFKALTVLLLLFAVVSLQGFARHTCMCTLIMLTVLLQDTSMCTVIVLAVFFLFFLQDTLVRSGVFMWISCCLFFTVGVVCSICIVQFRFE